MTTTARALVTGINGFVGGHLLRELVAHEFEVVGVGLGKPSPFVREFADDYLDHDLTLSWPSAIGITHVVHLAALSAVGPSFDAPLDYLTINGAMVVNLGEYQLSTGDAPRTLVVSSGAVYDPDQPLPIAEDGPVRLNSPYAVSKVLVENLADYYCGRGLDWLVARPFNHIGPGQGPGFVLPDLFEGCLAAVEEGRTLRVGDLTTRRDYSDVRDVVRAYRLLLELPTPLHRTYNVCSTRDASGAEVLAALRNCGVGPEVGVEVDHDRIRPNDPQRIVGNNSRLANEVGWAPAIPLEQSVRDFVASANRD